MDWVAPRAAPPETWLSVALVAVAPDLEPIYAKRAHDAQVKAGQDCGRRQTKLPKFLPEPIETRDQVAAAIALALASNGISSRL